MPTPLRYVVTLTLCLVPAALAGQGSAVPSPAAWWPRVPVQGSLVRLVLRPSPGDSVTAVSGELAGEPLHFERFAEGFGALGAVPFSAADSATAQLVVQRAGVADDTVLAALPVAQRRVPRERLRVAPQYAEPPESLTERIRLDQEMVQDVRRRAHQTPRLWQAAFVRPCAGAVTSVFGVARVFNEVLRSRHWGVDFRARWGAPVHATNRGVVALVADLYYSGTTVLIDHGAGLVTGYFHLSRVLVSPGDTVDLGQAIGRVGATGRVTNPHLHWFAAYGSITVDPLDLIRPNGPVSLTRRPSGLPAP
jgi:murein DD-endopeptidase MepM/ murein hydrolase activator NlpD